jgi:16S rRNA processing protein RimM
VKTQGRHGEVAAELHTDFPERFSERRRLFALMPSGARRELQLENFWPHKGRIVLKFAGVGSISEAEALVGSEIQIPAAERVPLDPGVAYVADLVGCEVLACQGAAPARRIGAVADVQFGAGEAPLLVVRHEQKEFLIPFVESFVREMDTARKHIVLSLPEGLLEVDAPMTAEEKERQRRR